MTVVCTSCDTPLERDSVLWVGGQAFCSHYCASIGAQDLGHDRFIHRAGDEDWTARHERRGTKAALPIPR